MNDTKDDNLEPTEETESFADLLDSYTSGMSDDIDVGDKIRGKIISIGRDAVYVETGTKLDGVVDRAEVLDDSGELTVSVDDELDLFVISYNESEIKLSRALSGVDSSHMVLDAFQNKIPVEGKVDAECKGGFTVTVMGKRAFCPISQMDLKYVDKPEQYLGESYHFLITRYEERGKNIVISRREYLDKELAEDRKVFLSRLAVGTLVDGNVSKLMPFGAFIELFPGIEGMAHISELSWSRIETPQEAVSVGDAVSVKVIGIQKGDKGRPKIALSLKQAQGNPWETVSGDFKVGDMVTGTVSRCAPFGAFIEIVAGIEGLVHISEMSYLKRVHRPEDMVTPGDRVSVLIKAIDLEKKRISLSMRDAEGDPWLDIAQKYRVGASVTGTVEKREQYGLFVNLEPGITGLYPKSKIAQSEDAAALEHAKPGDRVSASIIDIKPQERKITLGPSQTGTSDEWQSYTASAGSPMGDLGDKLKQALSKKKQ